MPDRGKVTTGFVTAKTEHCIRVVMSVVRRRSGSGVVARPDSGNHFWVDEQFAWDAVVVDVHWCGLSFEQPVGEHEGVSVVGHADRDVVRLGEPSWARRCRLSRMKPRAALLLRTEQSCGSSSAVPHLPDSSHHGEPGRGDRHVRERQPPLASCRRPALGRMVRMEVSGDEEPRISCCGDGVVAGRCVWR